MVTYEAVSAFASVGLFVIAVITLLLNNKQQILLEIKISPDVVDADDIEMLEDLILVAVNDALKKVDEVSQSQMSRLTGGMNIPGLF